MTNISSWPFCPLSLAMADFAEIRRLHRLLDEEEGEPFGLSPPFACGSHDDEIHPSGGVLDSCDTRFDSLLELDESPTLDGLVDRNRTVEDSEQRYLDQVLCEVIIRYLRNGRQHVMNIEKTSELEGKPANSLQSVKQLKLRSCQSASYLSHVGQFSTASS